MKEFTSNFMKRIDDIITCGKYVVIFFYTEMSYLDFIRNNDVNFKYYNIREFGTYSKQNYLNYRQLYKHFIKNGVKYLILLVKYTDSKIIKDIDKFIYKVFISYKYKNKVYICFYSDDHMIYIEGFKQIINKYSNNEYLENHI